MFITTLFGNRNFRNYFFADIISGFGTGMSFIGANWFVLQHTGKNSAVGIVMMISFLSGFLVSPFAGTLADRFNRRTIMRVSNAVRAIIILIVAAAIIVGSIKMYFIYFLAVLSGIGWTVFIPASRGLVQEILTPEEYVNGSSLVEVSLQTGMFCAAAACGVIYKYSGFATILIIDAATFFASNFFLSKIIYQAHIAHDREQSFITQLVNGGKYLMNNRSLFWFGIIVFIPFVATMSSNVVLPGYVSQYLKADSVVFGIADSIFGMGACLAGFFAASISLRLNKFRTTILFFLTSITALFFLVSNSTVLGLYIASLFFGAGHAALRIVMNSQIMDVVPKSYMGRCQAVWMSVSMILQISSMYGVGRLMDNVSARYGFLWLACIMLIGFVGYLRLRPKFSSATATFAGGCFWCIEASFEKVSGVHEVVSGYTGGKKADPTYEEVSSGTTGHLESIQVKYDPKKITYEQLLDIFWSQIDPTDDSGQFVDKGSQYRTAIFYNNDEQKRIALASKSKLERFGVFNKPIVTEIIPAGIFYRAEEYHQDFYKKDPEHYKSYRASSGRDEFLQKAQCSLKNAPQKSKLTDMQFKVTQEGATEPPFQNEYWNNKREGIYVDIVTGEPLFSSKDKFDSGTGWPSFTKPIESGNVLEKKDNSLFMERTEVKSKTGNSHLGHVFDDGPGPTHMRYCINSSALRFIPKEDLEKEGYGQYRKLFEK